MPMPVSYARALVTGASSGIGEAFARALARRRTDLVLVARREGRLQALAGELGERYGIDVEVLAADLTDGGGLDQVVARVASAERPVDLLVNNAGFGTSGRLVDIEPERLDAEVRLNAGAVVALTRAALPGMIDRQGGGIVNVSSVVGFSAMPKLATYAATKAFVTSFTEAVAEEARPHGVRVQALCPGLTRTEFQQVSSYEGTQMPTLLWQEADEVVVASLAGLDRGRVIVIPGVHNRGMVAGAAILPRVAKRRAVLLGQRLRGV
jgi:uncharacterized protein